MTAATTDPPEIPPTPTPNPAAAPGRHSATAIALLKAGCTDEAIDALRNADGATANAHSVPVGRLAT